MAMPDDLKPMKWWAYFIMGAVMAGMFWLALNCTDDAGITAVGGEGPIPPVSRRYLCAHVLDAAPRR